MSPGRRNHVGPALSSPLFIYDAKKAIFAFSYAIIGAMRLSLRICVGVVVLLALADGLAAQAGPSIPRGTMDGIVTVTSLAPIAGATISLLGSPISAQSGENGRFRIVALPAGEYVVLARRLGYASASVTLHVDGGDTLRPSFALRRVTPELDTVRAWRCCRVASGRVRRASCAQYRRAFHNRGRDLQAQPDRNR